MQADSRKKTTNATPQNGGARKPVVLVTGSTGLIGSRICRELQEDFEVVGLDRVEPERALRDSWVSCDLTDDSSVERALQQVRERHGSTLASVVHLAAYYDFSGEPSPLYDELTVEGTRRLLRGLSAFDVGQFVFSSSLLVMKPDEDGRPLEESSDVEAEWEYPRSKLDAELVIREEHGMTPAVVLRIAGVYDEQCRSLPIAQQMRRIYEEQFESYFFPGDPDNGQSFVHLEDLVRCFRAVIEHRDELGTYEVFLVGEPAVVSYAEMQDLLGEAIHGKRWPTIRIPAPLAKAGAWVKQKLSRDDPFIKPWMIDLADAHLPVTIESARSELGWRPRRSLRETLPAMAERLVSDPASWYATNDLEPPSDLEAMRRRHAERVREKEPSSG